jgi:hypothetical protein
MASIKFSATFVERIQMVTLTVTKCFFSVRPVENASHKGGKHVAGNEWSWTPFILQSKTEVN